MLGTIRVTGYHGTSLQAAIAIEQQRQFRLSCNEHDWLGDGVYFFQDAPERAWEWAETHYTLFPAVIGAHLRFHPTESIDLLDIHWTHTLTDAYDAFLGELMRANLAVPRQTSGAHRLDRAVINYAVGVLEQQGVIIRAVRAAFAEGAPVFPGSALFDRAHVQIAIRDPSLIDDLWMERKKEGDDGGS